MFLLAPDEATSTPMTTRSRTYNTRTNSSKQPAVAAQRYLISLKFVINPFNPRVSYGDVKEILTFESVDEFLWCYHSNETSPAVLSRDTIYILVFCIMKRLEF